MKQGWFRVWRGNVEEDELRLDPWAYKLWFHLLSNAQHTPYMDLRRGQCRVRVRGLAEVLSGQGRPCSTNTVMKALDSLEALDYIKRLERRPGRPMLIEIPRYDELMSEDQAKAVPYEYPPEVPEAMH